MTIITTLNTLTHHISLQHIKTKDRSRAAMPSPQETKSSPPADDGKEAAKSTNFLKVDHSLRPDGFHFEAESGAHHAAAKEVSSK